MKRNLFPLFGKHRFHLDRLVERVRTLEGRSAADAPDAQALKDLELRIAQLEARPSLTYTGVWLEGKTYARGDVVTAAGCLWHSNLDGNGAKPGS